MANETSPLVKLMATIGFFTGLAIGWNSTQNGWAALVCAIIVASLGAFLGNVLQRLLIIAISLLLAFGSAYVRHAVFKGIRESSGQYSRTSSPLTTYETPDATRKRARVIVARANLRSKPGDGSEPGNRLIGTVALGQGLDLLSSQYVGNGWYHVPA